MLTVPEHCNVESWSTEYKKVRELDADTIDLFIYVFVLVYAKNGRFIVTCVLYFR